MATTVIHIKDAPPGWKSNPEYVYIGRGSLYGNPYPIGRPHPDTKVPMDRDTVCDLFEARALPLLREHLHLPKLRGKTLVCFCKPERCHGDALALAAEEEKL